jgi:predicted NAD/FAD-binding protein
MQHQNQPRTKPTGGHGEKSRVAIIGTGLAGLTTAYLLHQDKEKRYEVTLFEQVDTHSHSLTHKAPKMLLRFGDF